MVQVVKHLILDLGSGHDITVSEFEPASGSTLNSLERAWNSVSLSLSFCPSLLMLMLMLMLKTKQNKTKQNLEL